MKRKPKLKAKRRPASKPTPHKFGRLIVPPGVRIRDTGLVKEDESEWDDECGTPGKDYKR